VVSQPLKAQRKGHPRPIRLHPRFLDLEQGQVQPLTKSPALEGTPNHLTQKLWDIATASKMQILMSLFMMWVTGNNINIVLIFLVFKGVSSAVGGLIDVNKGNKRMPLSVQIVRELGREPHEVQGGALRHQPDTAGDSHQQTYECGAVADFALGLGGFDTALFGTNRLMQQSVATIPA
jgi:hypothetical protein